MPLAPLYEVVTHNDATASDNRIHSDDIAKKYGFRGGLVPGVTVFGHLTHPIVEALGEPWLRQGYGAVRFLKPAYDGETLVIHSEDTAAGIEARCLNTDGVVLATLTTQIATKQTSPDALSRLTPAAANPPREEINRETIPLNAPLARMRLKPSITDNREMAQLLSDRLPLYARSPSDILSAPVHPFWFARVCNRAFVARWIMPAWIHVGTEFRFHRVVRVDQEVEVRSIPIRVWENKGHEFATLYLAFLVDGDVCIEAWHTAIFKIAEK